MNGSHSDLLSAKGSGSSGYPQFFFFFFLPGMTEKQARYHPRWASSFPWYFSTLSVYLIAVVHSNQERSTDFGPLITKYAQGWSAAHFMGFCTIISEAAEAVSKTRAELGQLNPNPASSKLVLINNPRELHVRRSSGGFAGTSQAGRVN